ncbi:MAG: hypothetical protein KA114_08335 [Bacteroidales bacterium]|nr:hypothetical protein [Bacteroidales bacterium]
MPVKSLSNNKILVIINPKAGRKRIINVARKIDRYKNVMDYAVFKDLTDFRNFIRENIEKYEIFVAAGGDGTVNTVASEIAGSGKILAVLPVGSGNGFAREMGFRKNIKILLRDISKHNSFKTDIIFLNNRPCINVAGLGIDSFVAHVFHDSEKRGFWSYILACFKVVVSLKPIRITINIENNIIEENVFMLSVTNTRQFGNHAIIVPRAVPDDGKFNIVIVRPFPKIMLPFFAIKLLSGTLKESKYIRYYETDQPVTILSSEPKFHIDGEAVLIYDEINVTIKPKMLDVLVTARNKWVKKNIL